ncbi:MAG: hypothetical protein JWM47_1409 [Acidimicrobiales bacterium]|nr:hypothetical protein [Acidimicrobiales bacterium]
MRPAPTFATMVTAEATRARCRPIVGRLPLLVAPALAASTAGLFASGIELRSADQLRDVSGIAGMVGVVIAFAVGAGTTSDALTSGMAASDRFLLGRPRTSAVAQQLGMAAWVVLTLITTQAGLAVGFVVGHLVQGRPDIAAGAWLRAFAAPTVRVLVAGALAGLLGVGIVQLVRSSSAAIAGLLTMLLIGDTLVTALVPRAAPLLVADNLFAIAKGTTVGLATYDLGPLAAGCSAVLVVVAVAGAAALVEGRRDLP